MTSKGTVFADSPSFSYDVFRCAKFTGSHASTRDSLEGFFWWMVLEMVWWQEKGFPEGMASWKRALKKVRTLKGKAVLQGRDNIKGFKESISTTILNLKIGLHYNLCSSSRSCHLDSRLGKAKACCKRRPLVLERTSRFTKSALKSPSFPSQRLTMTNPETERESSEKHDIFANSKIASS